MQARFVGPARRTSSPRREKSADRMEGDTMMSLFLHLSTREVAWTRTALAREGFAERAPTALEELRIWRACIFLGLNGNGEQAT